MTTHETAPVPVSYEPVDAAAGAESASARVLKIGDSNAKRILILVGGREGGANAFRAFGRELTTATPDLQVWSVDRREQSLADLTGFAMSPAEATGYFLDGEYRGPK